MKFSRRSINRERPGNYLSETEKLQAVHSQKKILTMPLSSRPATPPAVAEEPISEGHKRPFLQRVVGSAHWSTLGFRVRTRRLSLGI